MTTADPNRPSPTPGLSRLSQRTNPGFVDGLKRDVLDDLFSREPEDWAEWAESDRDQV